MSTKTTRSKQLDYLNRYVKNIKSRMTPDNAKDIQKYLNTISPKAFERDFKSMSPKALENAYNRAKENHISYSRKTQSFNYDSYTKNHSKFYGNTNFSRTLESQRKSPLKNKTSSEIYADKRRLSTKAKRNYASKLKQTMIEAGVSKKEASRRSRFITNLGDGEFSKFLNMNEGRLGFAELFEGSDQYYWNQHDESNPYYGLESEERAKTFTDTFDKAVKDFKAYKRR